MLRSLAHEGHDSCNRGNIRAFLRIYNNVVVARGANLRYTPQVRGSQRSAGFPPVCGPFLQSAAAVIQRNFTLFLNSQEARKCWLV